MRAENEERKSPARMRSERTRDTVIICTSRKAGSGLGARVVPRYAEECQRLGLRAWPCESIDDLATQVSQLSGEGRLRAAVAAGGDGTVSLLAARLPSGTPIQVLPLGTENLLAKHFALPVDPEAAARVSADLRIERIDAGEANGRPFLLMFSCGLDAEVVRRLHTERTGHIRHFSYAKPIFGSLRTYPYPIVNAYCDEDWQVAGRWAMVFNLPRYAMRLQFAPSADPDDGLLDLCVLKRGQLLHAARYLAGVVSRRHLQMPDVAIRRSARIRIDSEDEVPYQLDGDFVGFLPVELTIRRSAVALVVPAANRLLTP